MTCKILTSNPCQSSYCAKKSGSVIDLSSLTLGVPFWKTLGLVLGTPISNKKISVTKLNVRNSYLNLPCRYFFKIFKIFSYSFYLTVDLKSLNSQTKRSWRSFESDLLFLWILHQSQTNITIEWLTHTLVNSNKWRKRAVKYLDKLVTELRIFDLNKTTYSLC
jgi:hypothetical protein